MGNVLTAICAELCNYFSSDPDRFFGDYSVAEGALSPSLSLADGQYYRLIGSRLNDGVHQKGDVLFDEPTFHGAVWLMRVPKAVLELADDVQKWTERYGAIDGAALSPFNSESFGGYSYSKSAGTPEASAATSWQSVFAERLKPYRKISAI